jgi:hypothetical protein
MLGLSWWVSLVAVLVAAGAAWLLGRYRHDWRTDRVDWGLEHRWTPWIVGALTTAVTWFVWGGLARIPVIADESAYVLQAEIFARGAWAMPAPPIPEFFEQGHVLVTSVLASKYPPGHSLVLAPGVLLGLPGLPVVILNGITGALLFLLARLAAGGRVALLTWLIWASCFPAIYFRAGYLSETTSSAAWLLAWWCFWHWHRGGGRRWMVGVAAAVGVVAITRPLTAVALALPLGIVAVRDSMRTRSWKDLGAGVAVGTLVLCIVPIWSFATIGTLGETPHGRYTRLYMPNDGLGFGWDSTRRAERAIPGTDILHKAYIAERVAHTPAALPIIAMIRGRIIARDMWYEWRGGLAVFALIGLIAFPASAWFAFGTLVLHVGLYLLYAVPATWTVSYMESVPILAFASAIGIVWVLGKAARGKAAAGPVVLALALLAIVPAARTWGFVRAQVDRDHEYFERFAALTRTIRDERAILFMRYAPSRHHNLELVRNPPGLEDARLWLVFDRGAENRKLLDAAPGRRPYLFDESRWTIAPLTP